MLTMEKQRPDQELALLQGVCPVALASHGYWDDDDDDSLNPFVTDQGIAVMPLYGVMAKNRWWGMGTGVLAQLMEAAAVDPAVRGVMLLIDSPGGEMAGTDELARACAKVAAVKPLYGCASGSCCSAAYYVACECHELWATATTFVGSIGIVARVVDVSKAMKAAGMVPYVFKTAEEKGGLVAGEAMTDAIKAGYEDMVAAWFALFEGQIGKREIASTNWPTLRQGKVYMAGKDGATLGLVDRLGTQSECMAELVQAAGLFSLAKR